MYEGVAMNNLAIKVTPTTYEKDEKEYTRVTSVAKLMPNFGLDYWKQKQVALGAIAAKQNDKTDDEAFSFALKAPDAASRVARENGTLIHELLRKLNVGHKLNIDAIDDESVRNKVELWSAFRREHNTDTILAERTLFSDKYNIAGTLDLFWRCDGVVELADVKTGGVYETAFIQLAAYLEFLKELPEVKVDLSSVELVVYQIKDDKVVRHTPSTFFKKGGRNAKQQCHIPTQKELFTIFRSLLLAWRFQVLKVGKWTQLVEDFSDMSNDVDKLLTEMELQNESRI